MTLLGSFIRERVLLLTAENLSCHFSHKNTHPLREKWMGVFVAMRTDLLDWSTQYVVCFSVAVDQQLAVLEAFAGSRLGGHMLYTRCE